MGNYMKRNRKIINTYKDSNCQIPPGYPDYLGEALSEPLAIELFYSAISISVANVDLYGFLSLFC